MTSRLLAAGVPQQRGAATVDHLAPDPAGAFGGLTASPPGAHRVGGADAVALEPAITRLVRIGVVVRATLALAAAAVGSFLPGLSADERHLFVAFGVVWLPVSIWFVLILDRADRRLVRYGGPIIDLFMLTLTIVVVPEATSTVLALMVAVVAFSLNTCPELPRAVPGLLAMTCAAASVPWGFGLRSTLVRLGGFAIVLAVVTTLRARLASQERAAKLSEALLNSRADTILRNMPIPLVITDGSGRLASWNTDAEVLLVEGAEPKDTCAHALDLHVGERALDCSEGCALLELCGQNGAHQPVEVWRPVGYGDRMPLLASASEIRAADGRVTEVIHAMRDITRLKQAEEAKTLFLATASHELKTPLTVINGFAEMLLTLPNENEQMRVEALEAIARRSSELSRIVDRLLLSSRIESGRLVVAVAAVDVTAVIEERASALETATGRKIRRIVDDATPEILADAVGMATVIDHLLDNAIKYSPEPEPIEVLTQVDGAAVRIEIVDHGIGMDLEQRVHCFDKFWQAESTDARRYGGAGIGLYIVKSMVESMGATIDVRSELGQGTTFTLTFDRAETASDLPAQRQASEGELEPEPSMIREFMRQIGVPTGDEQ